MTCTPDKPWRQRLLPVLALVLAAGAGASDAAPGAYDAYVAQAHAALARGDGIAAEMALRKALGAGLPRDAAAARMGEAYLDQADFKRAREWLAPRKFTPAEAPHGYRVLGRLEMAEGNLAAAGAALDAALRLTPEDSRLWVDIARLRYAGGQHLQAIEAADKAVQLDPANVRALEFRGLLVRDQYGLAAALPWFERALKLKPDDTALLGEYAATLGELGRAKQMLTVTRRIIELEPRNPRAFFLQSVLAARAGNTPLARRLLARAGANLSGVPAALELQGLLELEAGNANLAVELLGLLSRRQPQNRTARQLYARAVNALNDPRQLVSQFAGDAARQDASPWLLTLVARAYEDLGERDRAAPLLDRAARAGPVPILAVAEPDPIGVLALRYADAPGDVSAAVPYVRQLLAGGQLAQAVAIAEKVRSVVPGSADAQLFAGDLRMARGDYAGAVEAWRMAGAVRLGDALMLRLVDASLRSGRADQAETLVRAVLVNTPRSRAALRLAAGLAARDGDWAGAARMLRYLVRTGGSADARLQADLAFALERSGETGAAIEAGETAYRLQRASVTGTKAWGTALGRSNQGLANALKVKAERLSALDAAG